MKLVKRIQTLAHNTKTVLNAVLSKNTIIGQRQIQHLMNDQLGSGWIDRVFVVRSRLQPERVDTIIDQASSRTAGRLGPLYELLYYTEQDARIGGLVDKRIGSSSRVFWDVVPGNKDNSQSVDASHFISKYIEDIRFKQFLQAAMDGRKYGVTGFHNIIREVGGMYVFDDPTNENQISQSRWWQERSNDENWGQLYLKNTDGKKLFLNNEDDIHPAQLTVFINKNKRGYYDTTGFMNRVLRLYVAKIWTLTFLMQSIERFGKPFLWSTLTDRNFRDEEFKETVASVLRQFSGQRWGVFPEGFELEYLDASSATQSTMHHDWLNFINTEMAIAIVGQNLSTEVDGGSFAAAVSHASVEQKIVEEDIEWLEEQINDEFLYWLVKINYPEMPVEDYPKLTLTQVKDVDVEKVARGYKALSELIDVPIEEIRSKAQTRPPRIKEDAEEGAVGLELYDEEVVGPSTRNRSRTGDALLRALGA